MNSTFEVPEALRDAWVAGEWRHIRDEAASRRMAALPELQAMLGRFLNGETRLAEFVKESQDFSFAEPHWGFKGFAQMQLNQYVKVAHAADLLEETEQVLRSALAAPAGEDEARRALREMVNLTQRLGAAADRIGGLGKPAPGRIPLVVSYFWEAQAREQWPIAYRASKEVLERHGHYREEADPVASYLAFREAILAQARQLRGDVWDVEALLWVVNAQEVPPEPRRRAPQPRVWLVRAGERGIHETLALEENVVVIGWSDLGPLSSEMSRDDLREMIRARSGEERPASLSSQAGQIHRFINEITADDLVVLPRLATRGHVAIGRIVGDYVRRDEPPFAGTDARNTRPVEWLASAIPYERFDPDLRDAFGQQGTVSEIDEPGAAERLLAVVEGADASAIHLVLKWSPTIQPGTVELHREVAEKHGAVWWGRLGAEGATGLAQQWVNKLEHQLQHGSTTHVFLHSSAATWRARLLGVRTTEPDERTLVPPYYAPDAHHTLWVKLHDFEEVATEDITEHFVLAQSGEPVTSGGLGNQTPLIIRAKGATVVTGNGAIQFDPDGVRANAEALGLTLPSELYLQLVAALESGKHVILTGPPGTAKTTLAEAVANTAKEAGRVASSSLTSVLRMKCSCASVRIS